MSSARVCPRLIVVGGWGVPAQMLSALYGFWPGEVVPVSLDDDLLSRCHSLSEVTDELLSLYPQPSVWMGWSLGSQVAMGAAARQTGSVSSVITLGGFPRFVADDDWPTGMSAADFRAFCRGIRQDPDRYWLHFLLLMINGAIEERQERQKLKPWLESGPQVSRSLLASSLDWLVAQDQRDIWRSASVPVLHVLGGRDAVVRPWAEGRDAGIRGRTAVIPGMAHWPGGCSASDCWGAIQAFLSSEEVPVWAS
ncbi:MAG: alpha/beta fold hydrolase [Pseudomonadota bacterium]|nr:alpha/beta fold hydrolase [Pseudomonadota bacterium]